MEASDKSSNPNKPAISHSRLILLIYNTGKTEWPYCSDRIKDMCQNYDLNSTAREMFDFVNGIYVNYKDEMCDVLREQFNVYSNYSHPAGMTCGESLDSDDKLGMMLDVAILNDKGRSPDMQWSINVSMQELERNSGEIRDRLLEIIKSCEYMVDEIWLSTKVSDYDEPIIVLNMKYKAEYAKKRKYDFILKTLIKQ